MKRDYLSSSALKAFAKSPNHYIQYVTGTVEATQAMIFGSAFHCFVLEPDEFEKRYAVAPAVDRRTKAGKEYYNKFVEASKNQTVITLPEFSQISSMAIAINEHKPAKDLLQSCTAFELDLTGQICGVKYRGIADGISDTFIMDLKTTQDSSPEAFERTAYQSFYHEQAAAYQLLFGVDRFYWIAIEKSPPYNVAVYMQSEESAIKAKHHLIQLIKEWDNWDGKPRSYSNEVFSLNLPRWAK